ncbi:Ni/Fe-hydrogenase 1 b-type cytochrome subunit [Salmonella enterica subsp. enterica]|uniref:Ni/Fe-hydrogenase 1 b-type cytochrome subunit n=1 Tax=Salmonella enterica I TaxID=59201 RepID=A0A3S4IK54_SALET|nr:Ni/Fe-hydrogenase 1 b-type cytochrome subunit [Salmonella enterica subsp. enterica]
MVRWYLFLEKKPGSDIGHNPVAQAAMFGYFLLSVFMILTGFALFGEHSQYAHLCAVPAMWVEFFYWTRRQLHRYSQLATDWACG